MSAISCPVCNADLWYKLPDGEMVFDCGKCSLVSCRNAERIATSRAAEIERLKARIRELESGGIEGVIADIDDDPEAGVYGGVDWNKPPIDHFNAGTRVRLVEVRQ